MNITAFCNKNSHWYADVLILLIAPLDFDKRFYKKFWGKEIRFIRLLFSLVYFPFLSCPPMYQTLENSKSLEKPFVVLKNVKSSQVRFLHWSQIYLCKNIFIYFIDIFGNKWESKVISHFLIMIVQFRKLFSFENLDHIKNELERSSRPDVFCEKGVLKNFAKFTGKLSRNLAILLYDCLPINKIYRPKNRILFWSVWQDHGRFEDLKIFFLFFWFWGCVSFSFLKRTKTKFWNLMMYFPYLETRILEKCRTMDVAQCFFLQFFVR